MARKDGDEREPLPAIDMTPMIDCTFNLLIFFLCNVDFRLLEGKLPLFLPRDLGVAREPTLQPRLERLAIEVARRVEVDVRNPRWTWDERQLELRVQGVRVRGLAEIHRILEKARARDPELRVELRPARGTLYVDAVKVLNECVRARATDVVFKAAATEP